ncbi:metabotropic glutamate receptor 2 isoform X3 [Nasonia vitripennis]|uniref:G-protein coupled receptors family 3 profile domain-containing protein n=1 Tax=Nasonia vitripennis TaxID=7425 RepID=A0A7M7QBW2_NASVI|nr:metabotropic glutamate receptor 2 isoform X3 [Nasonia vitripennis]
MIRLHQSVALMALCLTVVAAGLILESPATTFVAIGDAVTAASIQRASFSSAAVPSPGSKDEIETTSTKVKIAAIDSSSDNEGYRVSSHLSPISTVAATNTRIVKTDLSWIGKTNEKIIPVTSSTSSAVAVNWPTQSVPVVNLKPNLESILSEMPLASTEIVNKLVATAATSISSLQSISISTEPWKIAPSSLRNTMQTFTGDWKKSSITNARSLPGFDNYASTKASISSGVAGTRSMANYIEETIGNYQVPNAVGRFGLGGLEKVSSAGSEANLYGEPVSSGINEFIGPENSAKPEERKNGGLKVANVGHTSAIESNNEQEEYKEQYARTEMQPLIMTAVGLLVKTETEKVKRGEEEKEDARGEKAADCISNWQSISTREELNKAPSRSTGLEVESRTLSAAPLLFKLATTKGQLLRRRERRLSFNATSFAPTKESPQLRLPLDAEIEETTADPTKSHEGILDRLGITPEHLDIGFSTFQPRSSSSNVSIGRERSQQSPARNESEDWTKVIAPVDQWPVKHSAVVEGELVLGGLMMVHEREDSVTCGPVMPQGGIQALEAMLYTLDRLNQRGIVPGVKVGAHILDDCDKDTYGLEMAVDFIKGSISNIDGAEYHCNKTAVRKVISGVVGAASSVTSIQVANLLRLFRIPQVSFFSTSPELSNKQRFEYFTRTIPSDHYQVKAMVEIIKQMNWTYVSVIYEESNYGVKAFEELESLLAKNGICIAIKEKLVKDSGVADESVYDSIVQKLLTKRRARGCIIYGSDQEVAGLMKAVRRVNATGAFSWIGSDGWSARGLVSDGNEAEVEGTLSVQPQANPVEGFEEYFLNLTVENNKRNPWFVEFWEDHFKCRYPNSSLTPYNSKYENFCTTKERLNKGDMAFENQLQFVSDAVMAFAYAFRDMHNDLCHGKVGLCDEMKPTKGEELLKYLRKVDFKGLSSDRFKFDNNGDGPARYNIIHFKQTSAGQYKWIRVGQYLEGVLHLNMTEVQFRLEHAPPPESVCSLPCELGQAKKYVEGESCCWHCFNCTQYQIRKPDDETQCIDCPEGTVPDDTHSFCRDIPEEFLKLESGWAIGAMSFSSTGILVTFFVVGVFLKHNDTPVVRASGRELSYILLTGILLCYLVTFALVLRPTDIVCGIQSSYKSSEYRRLLRLSFTFNLTYMRKLAT